jgi:ABC-type uncharacterized transport system ATPase subunit
MSTTEQPPAVKNVHYDITPTGIWLQMVPAVGNPTTIWIPNRMLAGLARVLSGRVAVLADGPREGE